VPGFVCAGAGSVEGYKRSAVVLAILEELAGLPALWVGEPGQVRKEAATADYRKCRG